MPETGAKATRLMDSNAKLEDIKTLAEKLRIEIQYGNLFSSEFTIRSGYCKLKDKDMIILDKNLRAEEQIEIILATLRKFDLESVYISPWIRERLEKSEAGH